MTEHNAAPADETCHLFVNGDFTAHSGDRLPFKIDCDALTSDDLATLAAEIARRFVRFCKVHGIPRGGIKLADALRRYETGSPLDPTLIVDDVLTTGRSMAEARKRFGPNTIGVVIFARGPCLDWITPLFSATPADDAGWRPINEKPSEPMMVEYYHGNYPRDVEIASEPYRDERRDLGYYDGKDFRHLGTGHEVFETWWKTSDMLPTHYRQLPAPPPAPRDGGGA